MKFTIPIIEKISNNKLRTVHWGTRNSITKKYKEAVVKEIVQNKNSRNKFGNLDDPPRELIFTFYFYNRPLDNLNCAGIAKMCEDGLVTGGILQDDNPKYVKSVTLISKVDKNNPRITIELK